MPDGPDGYIRLLYLAGLWARAGGISDQMVFRRLCDWAACIEAVRLTLPLILLGGGDPAPRRRQQLDNLIVPGLREIAVMHAYRMKGVRGGQAHDVVALGPQLVERLGRSYRHGKHQPDGAVPCRGQRPDPQPAAHHRRRPPTSYRMGFLVSFSL